MELEMLGWAVVAAGILYAVYYARKRYEERKGGGSGGAPRSGTKRH